jgi:chromosome segregation ATPase
MVPTHDEARMARPGLVLSSIEEALVVLSRRAEAAELASAAAIETARHEVEGANGALASCRAGHEITKRQVTELRDRNAQIVKRAEHAESIGRQHANELTQCEEERDEARRIWQISQRDLATRVEHERTLLRKIAALETHERTLLRKIAVLETSLTRTMGERDKAKDERDAMRVQLQQEVERADENKAWAERAEQRVADAALDKGKLIDQLSRAGNREAFLQGALDTIRKVVATPDTTTALAFVTERISAGSHLRHLATVVQEISETLSKAEGGPPAQG